MRARALAPQLVLRGGDRRWRPSWQWCHRRVLTRRHLVIRRRPLHGRTEGRCRPAGRRLRWVALSEHRCNNDTADQGCHSHEQS